MQCSLCFYMYMYTATKHHLSNLCESYCLLNLDPYGFILPFQFRIKKCQFCARSSSSINNETDYTIILLGMLL